jgi:hypothetical protein
MTNAVGASANQERTYLHEQAARVESSRLRLLYENHEFNVPASVDPGDPLATIIDHSAACTCVDAAFSTVTRAQRVVIQNNSAGVDIQVYFNALTNHPVTVHNGETLDWDYVETTGLWIRNIAGVVCDVRIVLV